MAGHLRGADTDQGKAALEWMGRELWSFHMTQLLPLYVGVCPVEGSLDWKNTSTKGREKFIANATSLLEEIANANGRDIWL